MTGASETSSRDSAFWRFSLRFYALPEVAPACLALQDEAGVDVNLLLFLLFLADGGRAVTRDEVARLDEAIATWRAEVVEPLRALRRRLKTSVGNIPPGISEGLRNMVKKVELEAERLEQGRLENSAAKLGKPAARDEAARANLAAYEAYLGGLPAGPRNAVLAAFSLQSS
jgi:uncharacterized protein (TIGR02444 family)